MTIFVWVALVFMILINSPHGLGLQFCFVLCTTLETFCLRDMQRPHMNVKIITQQIHVTGGNLSILKIALGTVLFWRCFQLCLNLILNDFIFNRMQYACLVRRV